LTTAIVRRSVACLLLAAPVAAQEAEAPDAFAFLATAVALMEADRTRLASGQAVVRLLPRADREMAIFAAVPVGVSGERLVSWVRNIAELKKSEQVRAIGLFSNPPRIDDLADLALDYEDLDAIRECRPRRCGLKLSDEEMADLARAAASASDWRPAVQDAYRRVVLARVESYLASGYRDARPYVDQREPVSPGHEFDVLLDRVPFLAERLPHLTQHLRQFPGGPAAEVESFLYWSKETLGGKPMVIVSHVFVSEQQQPGLPEAVVVSRHVYANHYLTGSLAMTAVAGGGNGSRGHLMYLNRSRVDVLGGIFGRITRLFIERRLRAEAAEVVEGLRARIESDPPES
jgi:hypothetical protein